MCVPCSFEGRLAKIQELIDVRTVLTTDEELKRCQASIAEFKALGRLPDGADDEQMWEAQRTVDAIIHGQRRVCRRPTAAAAAPPPLPPPLRLCHRPPTHTPTHSPTAFSPSSSQVLPARRCSCLVACRCSCP